jgi:hypothetical protein
MFRWPELSMRAQVSWHAGSQPCHDCSAVAAGTMKAIVQEGYGSPDALKLREIEMPAFGDNGVLVEVHAASVTRSTGT